MHFPHRFSLTIVGILFWVGGLALLGCDASQNAPLNNAKTTENSATIAQENLLALLLRTASDSLQINVQTQLDSLTMATVVVPAAQLDSLLKELAEQRRIAAEKKGGGVAIGFQNIGRNIIWSIIIILGSDFFIRIIAWTLERFSEQSAATRRLVFKRLVPIVRIFIWSLAIYVILIIVFSLKGNQLLSALTALGLAVGLASQDILKNIIGGIIIIADQPFQVGDKISIGGTYGEVKSIGLRSTRIETPDDSLVSVPNAQVVESQVANANSGALDCQVVIDLYVPGWIDVLAAKAIAYDAAANSNYVFLEKPIVINVKDIFKETFLTHLAVKAYVIDTRHEFAFASEVTETAKAEFQKRGMLQPMRHIIALGDDPDDEPSGSPVENEE